MLRRQLDTFFARTKPPKTEAPPDDYARDREVRRLAQLSPEDRAWAVASLERHRDNEARAAAKQPPSA